MGGGRKKGAPSSGFTGDPFGMSFPRPIGGAATAVALPASAVGDRHHSRRRRRRKRREVLGRHPARCVFFIAAIFVLVFLPSILCAVL